MASTPVSKYGPLYDKMEGWRVDDTAVEYKQAQASEPNLVKKITLLLEQAAGLIKIFVLSIFVFVEATFALIFPPTPKDIRGKLALVTGGANGLGKEISIKLAQCGAKIALADMDLKGAQATAEELCKMTGDKNRAKAFIVDVSSASDVEKLHDELFRAFGVPVDILVNNAGLLPPVSLLNGSNTDIERIINVNYKSHFWMLRTFLPNMKSRNSGHIVSISSMSGLTGLSGAIAYSSTKFALRGLSLSLHDELMDEGVDGVHVTIAYPYFLYTRKELIDNIALSIPPVHPEEAARIIVDAMLKNMLQVSVPTHMGYFSTIISALPDGINQIFRKTFKIKIA